MNVRFKGLVKKWCPGVVLRPALKLRSGLRNWRHINSSPATVFGDIYRNHSWGGKSVSGRGSDLEQTHAVRENLPVLLAAYSVHTLLDLPCGDFSWLQHVDLGNRQYIGGDIVPKLIEENNAGYGSNTRHFCVLDLIKDPLPQADLVLCRDCLIHLSSRQARSAIANIARSGIPYLLTTNYPLITRNTDIVAGDFRAINLELPPFNFPKPLAAIPEDLFPGLKDNPNFVRELALWQISDIKRSLS